MGNPVRLTAGFTQDATWQPLGQVGVPDPFFYAYYEDDFLPYNAALYTATVSGGSIAATAAKGSGGRILFTTAATAASYPTIQLPVASFQYTATKKLAFLCRLQITNTTTNTFIAGLIDTTTTPFTTITDGIYFLKAAGTTNIVVNVVSGSATIGTTTLSGLLTANTDIDLGFLVDRLGNILIYAGSNLIGQQRQDVATLGPAGKILASSLTAAMTAVLLNPTLSIGNGATAAVTTGVADFLYAAQER
jgi:hypothetical protein